MGQDFGALLWRNQFGCVFFENPKKNDQKHNSFWFPFTAANMGYQLQKTPPPPPRPHPAPTVSRPGASRCGTCAPRPRRWPRPPRRPARASPATTRRGLDPGRGILGTGVGGGGRASSCSSGYMGGSPFLSWYFSLLVFCKGNQLENPPFFWCPRSKTHPYV